MTDPAVSSLRSEKARKRLRRRRAADARFRLYGIAALVFALSALVCLVVGIGSKALSAATYHVARVEIDLSPDIIVPEGDATPEEITRNVEGFYAIVRDDLFLHLSAEQPSAAVRLEFGKLIDRLAVLPVAKRVAANRSLIGQTISVDVPVSDDVDLFLKQASPQDVVIKLGTPLGFSGNGSDNKLLADSGPFKTLANAMAARDVSVESGSVLLVSHDTVARISSLSADHAELQILTGSPSRLTEKGLTAHIITLPESQRQISDQHIAWVLALKEAGVIKRVPHLSLLTHTDSNYPELAGTLAALVGSLLTMLVTGAVAIPIGIFAAIYLEEFARHNRLTNFIEVNINNLAAVPSIVFGLLGAALLLGTFGMPRSAPLVGGLVLALLILPVVIIASRAALRSVPPSISNGALAIGASRMQAVFHHVVPLAFPGMLTGAILGMARALGETAPLLLIGMVAFVAEVPSSTTDEATTLPVLIYSWASNAERAWEPMTAAAIVILLSLLVIMNVVVVILRRRFERRW